MIIIELSENNLLNFNIILDTFIYLTHLYLNDNQLSTLPKINYGIYLNNNSNAYANNDRYISIHINEFNCNCSMNWVNKVSNLITIDLGPTPTYCSDDIGVSNISLRCYLGMQPFGNETCPAFKSLNC